MISVMVGSMKSCWKTFYRQLPILSIQNVLLVKELVHLKIVVVLEAMKTF
jgi:hypothetical protein